MNKTAVTTLLLASFGTARADELVDHSDANIHAPKRHHVRMALELATIFTAGHEWYWRDHGKPNQVDWQLPVGPHAAEIKLTSFSNGWRFDGNPYDINAVGHPLFGTMTTFLARENGYGLAESFLISTLASGSWETFMELREYGSLNDMMMTSPAGLPIGETAYQIIEHHHDAHFELRSGLGVENGAAFGELAGRAELDRIPSQGDGTFTAGRRVGIAADMPTDTQGMRSVDVGAKSTLAGMYRNRGDSQLVVAVGSEFDYRNQLARPEREWDLRTIVAIGPSIDYRMRAAGYTVSMGADAYADFGLTKSEAFASWRAAHPMGVLRNVLENRAEPYYYAAGASIDPRITLARGGFVSGVRLDGTLFSSIDGADRDQEIITTHVHLNDTDAHGEAWLGYQHDDVSVIVDGRVHRRAGSANDTTAQTGERTAMVSVGYRM